MSTEILINVTPQESRVALVENGILQELMIERSSNQGIVGNIYKGKVSRVLPGMEAAFIDIGQEKAAFLHASDLRFPKEQIFNGDTPDEDIQLPPISELLHEGKYVLVQVIKDPLGTKGARLTMHVTIPSRYVVLMPDTNTIGVSSKIDDEEERKRLKNLIAHYREKVDTDNPDLDLLKEQKFGYIARTAAEGIEDDAIAADILFLNKLWKKVNDASGQSETKKI